MWYTVRKRVLGICIIIMICFISACGSSNYSQIEEGSEEITALEKKNKPGVVWDGSVATAYESGDGTPEHPYEIANGSQLAFLAQETNAGRVYYGQHFYLSNNIILNEDVNDWSYTSKSDIRHWTPIGTEEHPFEAVFLGDNYSISGLIIEATENCDYAGLFGYITNATIRCVRLESEHVLAPYVVGGLVAQVAPTKGLSATIEYCSVSGNINSRGSMYFSDYEGKWFWKYCDAAGGVVGQILPKNGTVDILGCVNEAMVMSISTVSYIESLKQTNGVTDVYCKSYGSPGNVGGIVGNIFSDDGVTIDSCINYGRILSHNDSSVSAGGIVGHTRAGTQTINCANMGAIKNYGEDSEVDFGSIAGTEMSDIEDGGYVSNCWYIPEYCPHACGRVYYEESSSIDIKVTTENNLKSMEWLASNLGIDDTQWMFIDGILTYIGQ